VESGDILVLYTDGVTEAENAGGEQFGTGRLCAVIAEHSRLHPGEIMAAIFEQLAAFTGAKPLLDDSAMAIFKIT
jgi:serine phosphatase RsbU (regulator of sigma subunit)